MSRSKIAKIYTAILVIAFIGSCVYGYLNPEIAGNLL